MTYKVYLLTNKINGKIYIGKAHNMRARWAAHLCRMRKGCRYPIYNAMRKHGYKNFQTTILAEYESEKEALDKEVECIAKLHSKDRKIGYNLTDGGEGTSGIILGEEFRENRRKYMLKHNPFKGRHHSIKRKREIGKQSKLRNSGEGNPRSKLTWSLVKEIRDKRKNGVMIKHLAKEFNVSSEHIKNIIYNKLWKDSSYKYVSPGRCNV